MTVRRLDSILLGLAMVALAYVFYQQALIASRVIDGTRYFWLDDDMMISMTYGRNLAEGHGLVWNPGGERVEGYTNFLWTLVMAGVHLTRVPDARAAVLVHLVNFGFLGASFVLAVRLLRVFAPRSWIAVPLLLVSMFMCPDVILWSTWGFETSLLTFLSLVFLVRLFVHGPDPIGLAALALIPLTRGDGIYIFAGYGLSALVVSPARRRTVIWLAVALVPTALHFLFRRLYYGDWLPNTYYLKVYGVEAIHLRGWFYARAFLLTNAVLLTLAGGSALALLLGEPPPPPHPPHPPHRRGIVLFVMVLSTVGYVILTGGDMFAFFRFFAHVMPIVFVFAALGVVTVARGPVAQGVWAAVVFIVTVPLLDPFQRLRSHATNGDPERQIQVAMIVKKNALPDSLTAVFCAGLVPYFTRLPVLDMLGKSDRHIARLQPFPGAMIGHGKVDPAYTLAQKPDLVVTCGANNGYAASVALGARTYDPMITFVGSEAFRTNYLESPVLDNYLLQETAVYTHPGSKEFDRRQWDKKIVVAPLP